MPIKEIIKKIENINCISCELTFKTDGIGLLLAVEHCDKEKHVIRCSTDLIFDLKPEWKR